MAKIGDTIETTIDRFDGGMKGDPRNKSKNTALFVSNFDALSNPHRLTPHQSSEDGNTNQTTDKIRSFCIGLEPTESATYAVYGLGVQSGASDGKIFYKKIATDGGSPDLSTDTWTAANDGEQAVGTTAHFDLFLFYKKTNKIYYARDSQHIVSYDTVNETTLETEKDLGAVFTKIGQGIVHSKDDIMYFPVDNVVWKNNNDVFSAALTLPTNFRIKTIAEHGNFLAIGCEPISGASPGVGKSIVFLWDRDSSLETLTESIYWGEERLLFLGEVNGHLIGISVASGTTWFDRRIVFRYRLGSKAVKFEEFITDADIQISQLNTSQQLLNNRLFFNMAFKIDTVVRAGIWSVGGIPGLFNIINERTLNNDTEFSISTLNLHGFIVLGDYIFQSYDIAGTGNKITKTTDGSTYSSNSVYEKLFNTGGSSLKTDLVGITIMTEPMPAAGQIVLRYKADKDSSWTTIFTNEVITAGSFVVGIEYTIVSIGTTDFTTIGASSNTVGVEFKATGVGSGTGTATLGSISFSAINSLPKDYKELKLRIESTGGAIIIGLSMKEKIIGKRIYN